MSLIGDILKRNPKVEEKVNEELAKLNLEDQLKAQEEKEVQVTMTMKTATLVEGEQEVGWTLDGQPVYFVEDGVAGELAPDGEHELSDGGKIIIAEGVLAEYQAPVEEEEEEVEVEASKDEKKETVELSDEQKQDVSNFLRMAEESLTTVMNNIKNKVTKAGDYSVYFSVNENLKVTWGDMSAYTYESLMMKVNEENEKKIDELKAAYEKDMKLQKEKYEAIIESHKSTYKPKPSKEETKEPVQLTRGERIKLAIQEKKKNK